MNKTILKQRLRMMANKQNPTAVGRFAYHPNGPSRPRIILQDWIRPLGDLLEADIQPKVNDDDGSQRYGNYLQVSNLNYATPCDKVQQVFEKVAGPIQTIDFYYDDAGRYTGKCRIVFQNQRDHMKAYESLNRKQLDGRLLSLLFVINGEISYHCRSVYDRIRSSILITNLPYKATKEDLMESFLKPFKDRITSVDMKHNPFNGLSRGQAVVYFGSPDDVEEASRDLEGQKMLNRFIKVKRRGRPLVSNKSVPDEATENNA